jgi:hypothetical protein
LCCVAVSYNRTENTAYDSTSHGTLGYFSPGFDLISVVSALVQVGIVLSKGNPLHINYGSVVGCRTSG